MSDPARPVVIFKKKSRPRPAASAAAASSSRLRSTSPETSSSATASTSAVRLPTKKQAFNPLIQGTSSAKRKSRAGGAGEGEDWEEDGVDVTWRTSGKDKAANANFVTDTLDWGADADEEAEKRKRAKLVEDALNDGVPDDGLYHGAAAYKSHLEKRDDGVSKMMKAGPVKASAHIRQITLIDYQPDVCKDYKETGWCGFGDTCKFLHDRGDYLNGWQLDEQHAKALKANGQPADASDDEDDIPFACLICRNDFGPDPVVTRCNHFFDSACAIKRFAKTPKCFACGAATGGIFNSATAVLKRLQAKADARKAEREERDGKRSDDEDGPEDGGMMGLAVESDGEGEPGA